MPSLAHPLVQRLRWQRGALENIGAYGVTTQTVRYWAQQLGIGYGVIALSAYFLLILLMVFSLDAWIWFPFWLGLGASVHGRTRRHGVEGRLARPAAGR